MAKGLYDGGEEALIRAFFDPNYTPPTTLYVGLFNDSADQLTDSAVESDITTEPTDGSYARTALDLSADFSYSFNAAGNFQATASNVGVTISGVTQQEIDAYLVATDTQANGGKLLDGGALTETTTIGTADTYQIGTVGVYIA